MDLRKMTDAELIRFNELCIDELSNVFSLSMKQNKEKYTAQR